MKRNSEKFDQEVEIDEKNNYESKQKILKEGREDIKAYLRIRPVESEVGNFLSLNF